MRYMCVVILVLVPTACVQLTEQQRNDVTAANTKIVSIQARLGRLAPTIEELTAKIKSVVEKIARGEMPKADGEDLIALYKSQRDPVEVEIRAGISEVKELAATVEAINDSGVPWYQQLWLLLPGIVAGAAGVARTVGKLNGANLALGVLARAGDATPGFGAAVHREAAASGVDVAVTNTAAAAARDKEI